MGFKETFKKYLDVAESYFLKSAFKNLENSKLKEAVTYSFYGGGKRFRPVLMLAVADYLNVGYEKVLPYALAIECVHAHSLIHDDLPSLDDALLRRGKPSCHAKFGEDIAILTGDWLLNYAYLSLYSDNNVDVKAAKELIFATDKMLVGQARDTKKDFEFTLEEILKTYEYKTSALISACFTIPLLLSDKLKAYDDFSLLGKNLGLLFQITDDLLDYKEAIVDSKRELNVVDFCGVEKALTLKCDLVNECHKIADKYEDFTFLKQIIDFVAERSE